VLNNADLDPLAPKRPYTVQLLDSRSALQYAYRYRVCPLRFLRNSQLRQFSRLSLLDYLFSRHRYRRIDFFRLIAPNTKRQRLLRACFFGVNLNTDDLGVLPIYGHLALGLGKVRPSFARSIEGGILMTLAQGKDGTFFSLQPPVYLPSGAGRGEEITSADYLPNPTTRRIELANTHDSLLYFTFTLRTGRT
jgi:hypothetical protein